MGRIAIACVIAVVVGTSPITAAGSDAWHWPTGAVAPVTRQFNPPLLPWVSGHRGVDLALPVGSEVVAAGAGIVVYAGRLAGRGVISVAHANGYRTTYEPVLPGVRVGTRVEAGDLLGLLDAGHCATGCLHLGLKTGKDTYANPLSLFGKRVRLMPT